VFWPSVVKGDIAYSVKYFFVDLVYRDVFNCIFFLFSCLCWYQSSDWLSVRHLRNEAATLRHET